MDLPTSHPRRLLPVHPLSQEKKLSQEQDQLLMEENQPFVGRKKWKWVLMTSLGSEVEPDLFCAASSKNPAFPRDFQTSQRSSHAPVEENHVERDTNPQKNRAEILEFDAYPEFSNFKIWWMSFR